eukprot:COSAG02_NODE_2830_length_7936_cov_40.231849_6_plen_181_part_00
MRAARADDAVASPASRDGAYSRIDPSAGSERPSKARSLYYIRRTVASGMPTSPHWEQLQRERRRRERYMGDIDRKWEAQSVEDDRLKQRWGELLKQGDAARQALGEPGRARLVEGVAVRVPTDDELAVALSWLHTDEPEYSAGAAAELVDVYEFTRRQHAPGTPPTGRCRQSSFRCGRRC